MAKPHRLKELEKEHGPLDELIPRLVNELGGQKEAAEFLGISQATISTWLKEHGYLPITQYVKPEPEAN